MGTDVETTETEGAFRLRLAVRAAPGEVKDLELEAHPSLTVGDAAEALSGYNAPATETLTLSRTGEELTAGLPLLEAGLRDGEEVLLGEGTRAPPPTPAELRIEGGTDAGRRVPLARGVRVRRARSPSA